MPTNNSLPDILLLTNQAFSKNSPVQVKSSIPETVLGQIPFFSMCRLFLAIAGREKEIKLTPSGYLPKKVVAELYAPGYIPDEIVERGIMKIVNEEHSPALSSVRYTCEFARLVKKAKGRLKLTKKGQQLLLPEHSTDLFKTLLMAFTEELNWSMHDGYPDYPIAQYGWLYSVSLLLEYGDTPRQAGYYAEQYAAAFPELLGFFEDDPIMGSSLEQLTRCYVLRTFDRFTQWFGFTASAPAKAFPDFDSDLVVKTDLADMIFKVK